MVFIVSVVPPIRGFEHSATEVVRLHVIPGLRLAAIACAVVSENGLVHAVRSFVLCVQGREREREREGGGGAQRVSIAKGGNVGKEGMTKR